MPKSVLPLSRDAAARHAALDEILGVGGAIAGGLKAERYEDRPQQREMARVVSDALWDEGHALIEAGTGVGKTFGYLVPLLLWASEGRRRVAVTTSTIALQEQLVLKDLPFLIDALGLNIKASLVIGRNNYLCLRRMHRAANQPEALFEFDTATEQLKQIVAWGKTTTEGTRQDVPFRPHAAVWEAVCAERGNCLGRKCSYYDVCHYQRGRRETQEAALLVVNHHVLMSDLAMRKRGASFLPALDAVVIDEGHDLGDVASEHFGDRLSARGVRYHLGRIWSSKRKRGLLAHVDADTLKRDVASLAQDTTSYFEAAVHRIEDGRDAPVDLRRGPHVIDDECTLPDDLSGALRGLSKRMKKAANAVRNTETVMEILARADSLRDLAGNVERLSAPSGKNAVRWMESGRRGQPALHSAPIDVAPLLREQLWEAYPTVVLTSATLTVGSPPSFAFVRNRLGVTNAHEIKVGSPFDYMSQAKMVIRGDLPSPVGTAREYHEALPSAVLESIQATDGDTLVLFTSNTSLRAVADAVRDDVEAMGLRMLVQGESLDRRALLERFREGGAVLFGVASFWQGVDVPGDALRHVVIARLPFPVPSHPLQQARSRRIEADGQSAFQALSLPSAVIRMKQGFGRLIRSKVDTGRVTILDSRLATKRYGQIFLDSLPRCPVERITPKRNRD